MATKREYYICSKCNKPIVEPEDGFLIVGEVCLAEVDKHEVILGENSYYTERSKVVNAPVAFHVLCFLDEVGLTKLVCEAVGDEPIEMMMHLFKVKGRKKYE